MKKTISFFILFILIVSIFIVPRVYDNNKNPKLVKLDENILKTNSSKIYAIVLADSKDLTLPKSIELIHEYKIINGFLVYGPKNEIIKLSSLNDVRYIWNNTKVYALSHFEDYHNYSKLWISFQSSGIQKNINITGANKLWELGINGSGIKVAVLDTGIDATHPDLDDLDDNPNTTDPKIILSISFVDKDFDNIPDEDPNDYFGHGTHVAGIIAGTGAASNGTYRGMAPGALLMNIKVLDRTGSGYWDWVIRGIEYAALGPDGVPGSGDEADIINLSLGGFGLPNDPVTLAVEEAWRLGVVVVVAAGNSGFYYTIQSPGSAKSVITVGAVDTNGNLAPFSSLGPSFELRGKPDILAPGVSIIAPRANNTSMGSPINEYYTSASGTSMATPHVSGAIALLLQKFDISNDEAKIALLASARDLGYSSYEQGFGMLDVYAAYCFLNGSYLVSSTLISKRKEGLVSVENDIYIADFFNQLLSTNMIYKPTMKDNIYIERMALRYCIENTTYFYWFSDLSIIIPLRFISDDVAYTKLATPDGLINLEGYVLRTNNSWFYLILNIQGTVNVSWISTYLGIDTDIMGVWNDNNATYDASQDIFYAYYTKNATQFFGLVPINTTTEHQVSNFWEIWSNIADDALSNSSSVYGDIGIAAKWNSSGYLSKLVVAIVFSSNIDRIYENLFDIRNFDPWAYVESYNVSYVEISSIGYRYPIPVGVSTLLNVTVTNMGSTDLCNLTLGIYVDDLLTYNISFNITSMNQTIFEFNISADIPGIHFLRILLFNSSEILDEIVRPFIILNNTNFLITPVFPNSNPLELRFIGQSIIYNITIINTLGWNLTIDVRAPDFISINYTIKYNDNESHGNIILIVNSTNSGVGSLNITILNNTEVLYVHKIYLNIENSSPFKFEVLGSYVNEGVGYRVPDFDGVLESDEDASLILTLRNAGNDTFYAYLVHAYFNDSYVYPTPIFGLIEELSPGEVRNISTSYYIYPDHPAGSIRSLQIIYGVEGSSLTMGYPIGFYWFEASMTERINGTPLIRVTNISISEDGDGDGLIEPGEIADVFFNATNSGNGTAVYVQVTGTQNVTGFVATAHLRTLPAIDPNNTVSSYYPVIYWISDTSSPGYIKGTIIISYYDLASNFYELRVDFVFLCGYEVDLSIEYALTRYVKPNETGYILLYLKNKLNVTVRNITMTVDLSGNVSEYYINELQAYGQHIFNISFEFSYQGRYKIEVEANAFAGYDVNVTDNKVIDYVYVDGNSPYINIYSPENNSYISLDMIYVNVYVYDDFSGLKAYNITLDGVLVNNTEFIENISEGLHILKVFAEDNCGNIRIAKVYFTVDKTPPTITILSPKNGEELLNGTIKVRIIVQEKYGIAETVFILNDKEINETKGLITEIIIRDLKPQMYYLLVKVVDLAGNFAVAYVYFRVLDKPYSVNIGDFRIYMYPEMLFLIALLIVTIVIGIGIVKYDVISKNLKRRFRSFYKKLGSILH